VRNRSLSSLIPAAVVALAATMPASPLAAQPSDDDASRGPAAASSAPSLDLTLSSSTRPEAPAADSSHAARRMRRSRLLLEVGSATVGGAAILMATVRHFSCDDAAGTHIRALRVRSGVIMGLGGAMAFWGLGERVSIPSAERRRLRLSGKRRFASAVFTLAGMGVSYITTWFINVNSECLAS